jgi:hypothetical protein
MNIRLIRWLTAAMLAVAAFGATAQQTALEQTYRVIQPQKVETGERIEVIDFFWYG